LRSADHHADTFAVGLAKLKHNGSYWLLCLVFGAGVGLVLALTTLMGQIGIS
jgi:hypothetical protein